MTSNAGSTLALLESTEGGDFGHTRVESYFFVFFGTTENPERIPSLAYGIDGFFDGLAQQDNPFIRSAQMFIPAVVNLTLRFLGNAVLIMRCDAPPAVVNASVNSRFVVFKAHRL